jgi:hypothetical protein
VASSSLPHRAARLRRTAHFESRRRPVRLASTSPALSQWGYWYTGPGTRTPGCAHRPLAVVPAPHDATGPRLAPATQGPDDVGDVVTIWLCLPGAAHLAINPPSCIRTLQPTPPVRSCSGGGWSVAQATRAHGRGQVSASAAPILRPLAPNPGEGSQARLASLGEQRNTTHAGGANLHGRDSSTLHRCVRRQSQQRICSFVAGVLPSPQGVQWTCTGAGIPSRDGVQGQGEVPDVLQLG